MSPPDTGGSGPGRPVAPEGPRSPRRPGPSPRAGSFVARPVVPPRGRPPSGAPSMTALDPARWYHLEGREQRGPIGLAEIRDRVLDGTVTPDTYVWADGMPDWLPARQVPALTPPEGLERVPPVWR
ncbi:DUF4339 domain-containing protein [Nitriliruptoraceae bacterium ZYF776]|nr:DUF4339 domain-containing protein [Profundirhabdus halotolerans]